jgi:hypothetical protein
MNPEEIHKIVSDAISSSRTIPFWAYLLLIVLPSVASFIGEYAKRKGENFATKEDFEKVLVQIEQQAKAVKGIEERIVHEYIEKREISKIQREKLEETYEALSAELELFSKNLATAATDAHRDVEFPSNKVEMLITLYFNDDLSSQLDYYKEKRKLVISNIRKLCENNMHRNNQQQSMQENLSQFNISNQLIMEYNQAKINIEVGLREKMRDLTTRLTRPD